MKCHYCRNQSIGINYKPRPQLDNIPVCQQHKSSLFIPFHDTDNIEKASFMEFHVEIQNQREGDNGGVKKNRREIQNQEFFQEFMEVVLGEFNLVKAEVRGCEDKMKKLDKENIYGFDIGCKITNPYMLLRQDKDMMLNTLLTRVKKSFESKKRSQKNPQHSSKSSQYTHTRQPTDIKGILSPKMKNSFMTVADSCGNNRSSIASPSNFSFGIDGDGVIQREKYFRKSGKM